MKQSQTQAENGTRMETYMARRSPACDLSSQICGRYLTPTCNLSVSLVSLASTIELQVAATSMPNVVNVRILMVGVFACESCLPQNVSVYGGVNGRDGETRWSSVRSEFCVSGCGVGMHNRLCEQPR